MTIVEYHGGRIDRRYLDKRSKSEIIQMHLDLLRAWERRESVMADAVTPALLYLQT